MISENDLRPCKLCVKIESNRGHKLGGVLTN